MQLLDFIYTILGQGIVFITILIIILFIIAITLGKILLKKNIILFRLTESASKLEMM